MTKATSRDSEKQAGFGEYAPHTRMVTYWLVGTALIVFYGAARSWEWSGNSHTHTIMETVSTMLALMVGVMALLRYNAKRKIKYLFISTGFLGTGLLDGYHAFVTSEFFAAYLPSDLPSLIPWSWVASRQFLSFFVCLSLFAWLLEHKFGDADRIHDRTVYIFSSVVLVICFLFFAFFPLPAAHYPEFIFERPQEFAPALLFLVALVGYLKKGRWKRDTFEHWLVVSLIINLMIQVAFMSVSGQVFDTEFQTAHFLKSISYVCVLTGLFIGTNEIFHRAEAATLELRGEVAERSLAELKLLKRTEELTQLNKELEQFAFIASHHLQEPLRKVQTFGERLKNIYGEVLEERGRDYITRMQEATRRMQQLVTNLLEFSHVSSKGGQFVSVDLNKIVSTVLLDLSIQIDETNAQVHADDLPLVMADPTQMRQLFRNLVGNALKYCRKDVGPVIRVGVITEEPCDDRAVSPPADFCVIQVKDNGIGFEQKFSDRVFRVFERLHGQREYSGTGIGLAICQKIVGRHGGKIWAESVPDEGTTFFVSLSLSSKVEERTRDAA